MATLIKYALMTVAIMTVLVSASMVKAEPYFNHATGEWLDTNTTVYVQCLKENIGNAHTDYAVLLVEAICAQEAGL